MAIQLSQAAPAFELPAIRGNTVSVQSLSGSPALLQFHRFAACPACNLTVRQYAQRYDEVVAAGLRVVMFFHSPLAQLQHSMAKHDPPFDVVADPDEVAYRAYGVQKSWLKMMSPRFMARAVAGMFRGYLHVPLMEHGGINGVPADFLVDAAGIVRLARYGTHSGDTLDVDALLALAPDRLSRT